MNLLHWFAWGTLGVGALVTLSACSSFSRSHYPVSDHYDGSTFYLPWNKNSLKSFKDLLKWQFTAERRAWPEGPLVNGGSPQLITTGKAASVHVTWIGHATTLIQNENWNILTDPIFSERASPVSFAGPKRVRPPALSVDELPPIHVVVISHNHYDHLDLPSLGALE